MSKALLSYTLAAQNNAWANQTIFAAIGAMDTATFTAPRPGFFSSLSRTLNHIYEADLFHIDAFEEGGLGRSVFQHVDVLVPHELANLQALADVRLIHFCKTLTEEILAEPRSMERKDGPVSEEISEVLPHLFQHQIHHRGQAHVQLQDAGIAPPQLDEFYMNHGRIDSVKTVRAQD